MTAEELQRLVITSARRHLEEVPLGKGKRHAPICALLIDGMRENSMTAEGDQLGDLLAEVKRYSHPLSRAIATYFNPELFSLILASSNPSRWKVREIVSSEHFRLVLGDLMEHASEVWKLQLQQALGGPLTTRPYAKCAHSQ